MKDNQGGTVVASITARLPQTKDTPPSLVAEFGWREAKGSTVGLKRALPLPTGASAKRIIGLTFVDNHEIVGAVGVGNTPSKWAVPFTAYYLTLQPVSISR
jgi:hypothetical protein